MALENCNPNIIDHLLTPLQPAGIPICKQQQQQASCEDDRHPSEEQECSPGRRACGRRVQSIVQAFESMISLSDHAARTTKTSPPPPLLQSLVSSKIGEWNAALLTHAIAREEAEPKAGKNDSDDPPPCEMPPIPRAEVQVEGYQSDSTTSYGSDGAESQRGAGTKAATRVTCLQPFNLRTQARGAKRAYEFQKKVEKMLEEDRRMKIPIAQGLPWTTDEPEILRKPPVKESTVPLDVKLSTEFRSIERADFDQCIAEKALYLELQRQEQERLQKLAEQEEIKLLRKQMVPKAQMMPYFDNPFKPSRSSKPLTIPREPHFHLPKVNSNTLD